MIVSDLMPSTIVEQIANAPDDTDAYLVLADSLQLKDDPRGELIILQHALSLDAGDESLQQHMSALLKKHRNDWLGDLLQARCSAASHGRRGRCSRER